MDVATYVYLRHSTEILFQGIYALAEHNGADVQAIRQHELAITMLLLNGLRRQSIAPLPD